MTGPGLSDKRADRLLCRLGRYVGTGMSREQVARITGLTRADVALACARWPGLAAEFPAEPDGWRLHDGIARTLGVSSGDLPRMTQAQVIEYRALRAKGLRRPDAWHLARTGRLPA